MEKTNHLFNENAVRAIKLAFNSPRLAADQIYSSWLLTNKRHQQIRELKSRLNDPVFLKDVGLSKEQVENQIALLESENS